MSQDQNADVDEGEANWRRQVLDNDDGRCSFTNFSALKEIAKQDGVVGVESAADTGLIGRPVLENAVVNWAKTMVARLRPGSTLTK